MSYLIGKCPKCGEMVTKRDLSVVQIRTPFWRPHFSYVCATRARFGTSCLASLANGG